MTDKVDIVDRNRWICSLYTLVYHCLKMNDQMCSMGHDTVEACHLNKHTLLLIIGIILAVSLLFL